MLELLEPGLGISLVLSLALVHFLAEELEDFTQGYQEQIISFASGVSITYIFVELIPEFASMVDGATKMAFVPALLGFSSIHLAEKYFSRKGYSQEVVRERYGEVHSAFLFLYHTAIGFLIASLVTESAVSGLLFFLPMILHVAVSSFSMSELHEDIARKPVVKLTISAAPLLGYILHNYRVLSPGLFPQLFGLVIGMFIYVVVRDSIPRGEEGKPVEYVLGLASYLAVIVLASVI